jgi:hypothetical protein
METEAYLLIAVTCVISAAICGVATAFGLTRLLRLFSYLWVGLTIILFVLAIGSASFDRRVFLLLWLYFALPALCGGVIGAWFVRTLKRRHSK